MSTSLRQGASGQPVASRLAGHILVLTVALLLPLSHVAAQLSLDLVGPLNAMPTGQTFSIRLSYRVASTTGSVSNAQLVVNVPAEINYVDFASSPHVASYVYDVPSRQMKVTFVSPLAAGTAGDLELQLAYQNGTTPNGLTRAVSGVLSGDGVASSSKSHTIEAQAQSRFALKKWINGDMTVDAEGTYTIRICNGSYGVNTPGSLTLNNVSYSDQLPAGAEFVRFAGIESDVTINYDLATRTVTAQIAQLEPGDCRWHQVVVNYPSSANAVYEVKTNTVNGTATPVGEAPVNESGTTTHTLQPRIAETETTKTVSEATIPAGSDGWYKIHHEVTGTAGVEQGYVEDLIPYETEVRAIDLGKWSKGGTDDVEFLRFDYQTNLNAWRTWRSNMNAYAPDFFTINAVGLSLGGPEYITGIRVYYGDSPSGTDSYVPMQVNFVVRPDATPGVVTNCATAADNTGATHITGCVDMTVEAGTGKAILTPKLTHAVFTPSAGYGVGDEVKLTAGLKNEGAGTLTATNVRGTLLLPPGMTFVNGSVIAHYPTTLGLPTVQQTPDFGGSGRTLLRFTFPSWSRDLAPREETWWGFSLRVGTETPGGAPGVILELGIDTDTAEKECWGFSLPDPYDIVGDGNTTTVQCAWQLGVKIASRAGISSELAVRGSLDSDYTTYPSSGTTLPGGLADYRLRVSNDGNIALNAVKVMSILPSIGDLGVVDAQPRDSRWAPRLVGPVEAPAGVTVYYSTVANPCRAADGFVTTDPSGCSAANWSPVPPASITEVHALLIDFGSTQIAQGETLEFTWPMRTPTDVLVSAGVNAGDVAWNSVGIIAARADNNQALLPAEPNKTGLSVDPLAPGVVGDRIWVDDGDGIQEVGEPGLDNVRVELYRDDGDGIPDIATDNYVGFTLSSGGGQYLFPALPTADYFVLFEVTPTYALSPALQGSDPELDSDGVSYYANGRTAAVTEVFRITDSQFDFSRDLGLEPSGKAAIGDYVWNDSDGDGTQNEGVSSGINGVDLRLLDASGNVLATTRTRPDLYGNPGYYLFDAVDPGSIRVQILVPDGTSLSAKQQGGDAAADSDGDPSNGGRTDLITLVAGQVDRSFDFALQLSGTEQCDNGIDDDGDGLVDCQDPDCAGSTLCAPRFACDNTLYQTIKGADDQYRLYRVDVSPVNLIEVANLTAAGITGDPNSTVLNPRDGYIYTVDTRSPWAVHRITGDFAVTLLGNLSTPPGTFGYNAGAIDRDGNWLVRDFLSGQYHVIDIDNLTASLVCDFSDAVGKRNIGDLDYNPVDGRYYGTVHASDSLISYDFATCSRTYTRLDRTLTGSTGAFWISASGVGYGYENDNGNLLRINLQTGVTDVVGTGAPTAQTDGCSCQGVQLDKVAVARTIRKGEVNTYTFTIANRYVTTLPGVQFTDQLPAGAQWVGAPYDLSPGLSFAGVSGIGTATIEFTATNLPQISSSFKLDYVVDPSYTGAHPMPNQAELTNLPMTLATSILSDDPTTTTIGDATLVDFFEHCSNNFDDDSDGFEDCLDGECPAAEPVLRVNPN